MLIRLVCLPLLLIISPVASFATESVAVIGAGAAGIAAAQKLMDSGYSVKVFEKSNRIGGKCYTIPSSTGIGVVDVGAIQVGAVYETVTDYAEEMGHELRDYWPARSLRWAEDEATPLYKTLGAEYLPFADSWSIANEILVLRAALQRFQEISDSSFIDFPIDSEFNQPFEAWADQLGLTHFKEIFRVYITSYGYGQLKEVPAYLPLYLMNSSAGLAFITRFNFNMRMFVKGYGGFLDDMVKHYGIPVQTEIQIKNIKRSPEKVAIAFEKGGQSYTEEFDRLVVACGLECIREFLPERTTEEDALLRELYYSPYDVVIADVPGLPKGGYVLPQNLERGQHVGLISKNVDGADDAILYIPRGKTARIDEKVSRPSEERLAQIVKQDMARFGFDEVKILFTQYWDDYFPHFRNPHAYRLLDQIQGDNRTYYVGSVGRFEIVEKAMSHAVSVMDRHLIHPEVEKQPLSTYGTLRKIYNWYFNANYKEVN